MDRLELYLVGRVFLLKFSEGVLRFLNNDRLPKKGRDKLCRCIRKLSSEVMMIMMTISF